MVKVQTQEGEIIRSESEVGWGSDTIIRLESEDSFRKVNPAPAFIICPLGS
ncbi:hypothetical protein KIS1582_3228 [Cytobacillus firmus]|uniref:Uncharacterized protein n=1 Tax=Cytobacillus firmus TaxID=1399 RepID=A0A800N9W2_CYTFI|nr:hypothetical protein KIS1582_3228 [Cytobacillus firmus]